MSNERLIIVSNRPPISIHEGEDGLVIKSAPGGLASAMRHVHARPNSIWVGWSGMRRALTLEEFQSLELGQKLALVNLETELYHRYYDAFANGSLWPVFHGFTPRRMYDEQDFAAAETVTDRFARCVAELARTEDVVWVHDFHLVLLPEKLRAMGLRNRVGFFLHIPFPAPEIFATLPDHERIARSLAQSDLIGFQTPGDVKRFEEYAAMVGLHLKPGQARAFPIGIDFGHYAEAANQPGVQHHLDGIFSRYEGKRVLFSISRLDYTKGILHQLQAIDALLAANRGRRDFVYKLVVAPSREDLAEYQDEKLASKVLVDAINQIYGDENWQPVEFDYRSYDFDELVAWYRRADIMLVTPLIDGMNLIAKEYVAAHGDNGMLVLGQGAGASAQLSDAVIVNPRDPDGVARALQAALDMPSSERTQRMKALRDNVRREDVHAWAEAFLTALVDV